MLLYSTSNRTHTADITKAILQGLADDGGLYMLERISRLPSAFFYELPRMSFGDMAVQVMQTLLGEALSERDCAALDTIVREVVSFDAPLVRLNETTSVVELFHGPTLAFKDFGARFMAQMMRYLRERSAQNSAQSSEQDKRILTVLVATSGDTGSAVARGFWKIPGIRVVILYPQGKVSRVQEQQLTTMGENVIALEVEGTFDDCQALVKTAFQDTELNEHVALTSANSINIARLLPQSLYYFRAFAQLQAERAQHGDNGYSVVFCTPSGNFGNLTAGMIAAHMGLPVQRFVAGVNRNDTIPLFLQHGEYRAKPSVSTPSNAMDVGNPSNFARLFDLYGHSVEAVRSDLVSYSISDEDTLATIKEVYAEYQYVMCPHTAVGYAALQRYYRTLSPQEQASTQGIVLATAHPAKFADIVEPALGIRIPVPERLQEYLDKPKQAIALPNSYQHLKSYLLALP
jgi:threonine synthase